MVKSNKYPKSTCNQLKHMLKTNTKIDEEMKNTAKSLTKKAKNLARRAKFGLESDLTLKNKIKKHCK